MPKPRRSKTLETVARSIKDSDEFVEHVFAIAARYRTQHALEVGEKGRAVRQAVKTFERHASALAGWLRNAQRAATAEHEALSAVSRALHGSATTARPQAVATQVWLQAASTASDRALETLKRRPQRIAPATAAEALRATFEHHGIKLTLRGPGNVPGDAARLLCTIAKDAGDSSLDLDSARQWLRSARSTRHG